MIHHYEIQGVPLRTGDLIGTSDRGDVPVAGQIWRLIGMMIPGPVDHIVVYVGPGGRCVEAGAKLRVIDFELTDGNWDAERMVRRRGPILDDFYGVAYPPAGRGLPETEEIRVRDKVARYCLRQAAAGKPYNPNFLNSRTQKAFYCSQLAYAAYLQNGIDLNTGKGIPRLPGTESIIFPQEIWSGCRHKRP